MKAKDRLIYVVKDRETNEIITTSFIIFDDSYADIELRKKITENGKHSIEIRGFSEIYKTKKGD